MSGLPFGALFEALANGLWRGSLLVIVAAFLLRVIKKTTAAERYAVWLAMLTVVASAPVAEVALRSLRPVEVAAPMMVPDTGFTATDWVLAETAVDSTPRWQPFEIAATPFLLLWLAVGAFFAVRLCRRCWLASALKRYSAAPESELAAAVEGWERDLAARRVGSTRVSENVHSPAAIGWLAPAVLLPRSAEADVNGGDLEMLWRHEQAHVSRRDDWTQLLAEGLFAMAWFHPAAYWLRRQLENERELACDEAVLEAGVEAHRYAGALGRWAERAAMSELPAGVMGLGRSRALIIRRIEMLLSPSRILRRNGGRLAFGFSLATAIAAAGLLTLGGPIAIRAQSIDAPVDVDVEVEVEVASQPEVVVEISEPVVVIPAIEPEVRIKIPVIVPQIEVNVEPVLLGQAAPPAPPKSPALVAPPVLQSAPAPQAAPAPPVPPAPPSPPVKLEQDLREKARAIAEEAQRWHDEMQPEIEEIQREAQRIQEYVRESFGPQQEKLQAAARKLAEEHRTSLQPLADKMAELGSKMGQAFDAAQRNELQQKMQAVAKRMQERQPEFRRLEEEMSRIQIDMEPFEERMKELGEKLKEKHHALEKARREFEESNNR